MTIKSLLGRKVSLAFGASVAIVFVVGVVSLRGMGASREGERLVRHTHEVLEGLQDLLTAMQAIESSYRGFVLTGDDVSLEGYRLGVEQAEHAESRLRGLLADNPERQERLSDLERLADQKIQIGRQAVNLRRTLGLEAASESIRGGSGQRIMNQLQGVVNELQDQERRLLVLRTADATRRASQAERVLIFGGILALLIAVAAGWSAQHDNHRRQRVEAALQQSEEQYRLLLDGVRGYAIFMMDPQGQILSWNADAERIKGYRAEEIIGHNFACFFPPDDVARGKPEDVLRRTAASGRYEDQGLRVRKDGTQFLASVTVTALRDSAGRLRGFSEFSHDLTESRESGAKYRGLLEAAPDAMVVVNQGGEIVLLNVQAEKQFGYSRDELVGQKVTSIIPEGFAERLIADGTRSAAEALAQQIGTGIELTGRRKDGSEFPIEIMLSPLESAEGILVTAAIRDISVRRRRKSTWCRWRAGIAVCSKRHRTRWWW